MKSRITPVDKHLKESLKNLKKSSKKFAIALIIFFTSSISVGLVYFYIEHCRDPGPQSENADKTGKQLWKVCQHVLKQQHNNGVTDSISNDSTPNTNNTNLANYNTSNIQSDPVITELCQGLSEPIKIECELTKTNFFKYFDLAGHIAFTIGKNEFDNIFWFFPV